MTTTHGALRVAEFYSGLGGMHCALRACRATAEAYVVAAVEINTNANEVYRLNFPDTPLLQQNILGRRSEVDVAAAALTDSVQVSTRLRWTRWMRMSGCSRHPASRIRGRAKSCMSEMHAQTRSPT